MPALKISKQDSELDRGEKTAYNLCRVLDAAAAANTWTVVPYQNLDYVVSVRIEHRGRPVGGPPLSEMGTRAHLREAGRWSREVARHLSRIQGSATFWSFPGKVGKASATYIVQVEAVLAGEGRNGHTVLMSVLRSMAVRPEPGRKSPPRKAKRRRNAP